MSKQRSQPRPTPGAKGRKTPRQVTVLADRRVERGRIQQWMADRADAAAERRKKAEKARARAKPQGGVSRVPEALRVPWPAHEWVAGPYDDVPRPQRVSHVNPNKDRSLPGKARRRARRATR